MSHNKPWDEDLGLLPEQEVEARLVQRYCETLTRDRNGDVKQCCYPLAVNRMVGHRFYLRCRMHGFVRWSASGVRS